MHALYFVIFDRKEAGNSLKAKNLATNTLMDENFCCQEGFFSAGKAEWFTVGGRWSGILQVLKLGIDMERFFGMSEQERKDSWSQKGGAGPCPGEDRHSGFEEYPDDAMVVDQGLWQKLAETYPEVEAYDANACSEDILADLKSQDVIGRWIVVIDYHL